MPYRIELDNNGNFPPVICECCAPRYATATFTAGTPHKYTKEEIESAIIYLSKKLVHENWWNSGYIKRTLKHWLDKLERYNEAEQEFKISNRD